MRLTKEALSICVVVRRAKSGTNPFLWEINGALTTEPIFVSPERFKSMEAAYRAGHARLPEFVTSARSMPRAAEGLQQQASQVSL
jgi:hypothetical protein